MEVDAGPARTLEQSDYPEVGHQAGHSGPAERAVGAASGTRDPVRMILDLLQAELAEGVETWEDLGPVEGVGADGAFDGDRVEDGSSEGRGAEAGRSGR